MALFDFLESVAIVFEADLAELRKLQRFRAAPGGLIGRAGRGATGVV